MLLAVEDAIECGTLDPEQVTRDVLGGFLSRFGRRFYRLPEAGPESTGGIVLERSGEKIPPSIKNADGSLEVGLSRAGDEVFSLRWR